MLLGGPDRHDQRRPRQQPLAHRAGRHLLESPGVAGVSHRFRWWVVVVLAAAIAAGEWLRRPSAPWAVLGVLATLAVCCSPWTARRLPPRRAGHRSRRAGARARRRAMAARIDRAPLARAARSTVSTPRTGASAATCTLPSTGRSGCATAAAATAAADREAAFGALDRLVPSGGPEMSVVVLDTPGAAVGLGRTAPPRAARRRRFGRLPRDWILRRARGAAPHAGRRRGRRQCAHLGPSGGARPRPQPGGALPRANRSGPRRLSRRAPRPDSADVFDYEEPTTAGHRLLFSVQPVPADQGTAKELAYERGSRAVTWLLLAALAFAFTLGDGADRPDRHPRLGGLARGPRADRPGARRAAALLPGHLFPARPSAHSPAPPVCWRSPACSS